MTKTTLTWTEEMAFEAELEGHTFAVDADLQFGGKNRGPRPKGLLLSALGGCTAMDVVSLLGKMKVPFERFKVEVEADAAEDHPKVYTAIRVRYILDGKEIDRSKVEKAVDLSLDKYCAVHAMLGKSVAMSHEILINGRIDG